MQQDNGAQERYADALQTTIALLSGRAEAHNGCFRGNRVLPSSYVSGIYLATYQEEIKLDRVKDRSNQTTKDKQEIAAQLDGVANLNTKLCNTMHVAEKELKVRH